MDGVLIIAGPTAVGKTTLALELAERFDAEIVGADARQIYCDMPVGTAAPTPEERARVPHHLVAFLDPRRRYSAARFTSDAMHAVSDVVARGKRVIVVGGTGFYIRALAGDVRLSPAYDPDVRARLVRESRLHPPDVLFAWLASRDPQRAAALAMGDGYRVARALEISLASGEPLGDSARRQATLRDAGIPVAKVFIDMCDADLEARIRARVDSMLAEGLLEEAKRVGTDAVAADAVGYREALAYEQGWCTRNELRALLVRATHRYAKRQRTWFRREPRTTWIPAPDAKAGLLRLARDVLGWA